MPTKPRPEDVFIEAFLSAYEDLSWADADKDWVDQRKDGGVEMLAKRKSDGKTLAIEHTVAQPFVGEIEDYRVFFEPSFLKLENDKSLNRARPLDSGFRSCPDARRPQETRDTRRDYPSGS